MFNRLQAAARALASRTYPAGMCLQWTRVQYGIAAKHPDAAAAARSATRMHRGDRNPPRGVPVFWTGGSDGHGHVAIALGGGTIRSTDAAGAGRIGTVPLSWPEDRWGLTYVGWAEDLNGVTIPPAPSSRVQRARQLLIAARSIANRAGKDRRVARINDALGDLPER